MRIYDAVNGDEDANLNFNVKESVSVYASAHLTVSTVIRATGIFEVLMVSMWEKMTVSNDCGRAD